MALDGTYDGLKASVADWLDRDDLTAQIPDFIALAELEIGRAVRRKKVRKSVQFGAATFPLPGDCAQLSSARLVTGIRGWDGAIDVTTEVELADLRTSMSANGRPKHAAVIGTDLLLVPAPDSTYQAEIIYFQELTPLSENNQSNIVLAEAQDIYLYGALLEAAPYLDDDARIPTWQGKFSGAIDALNIVREREEFSAAPLRMRLPVVFG